MQTIRWIFGIHDHAHEALPVFRNPHVCGDLQSLKVLLKKKNLSTAVGDEVVLPRI